MTSLKYVGPAATQATNPVTKLEVDTALEQGVNMAYVNQKVSDEVALRASKTYVDSADSAFASTTYMNNQDDLLIPTSSKGLSNGVASLDSSGRVPLSQLPSGGAGFWKGPYFPNGRYNPNVTSSTPGKLFEFNLPAPGFWWRPVVFGNVIVQNDASSRGDVEVCVGTSYNVAICAAGRSANIEGYSACAIVPYSILNDTGVPALGYNATSAVNITAYGVNPFGGTVAFSGNDIDCSPVLYLVRISDI